MKVRGYPKSFLGRSDHFESKIQNQECKEIVQNYGRENIRWISFDIFLMEFRIWNPESDTLTLLPLRSEKSNPKLSS